MSREEDKKLLAELMFVGEQLKGNIIELQKLDGIAQRAKALNELDAQVIAQKLKDMSLTHVARLITDRLNEQFESQKKEIYASSAAAEAAAKDLSAKADNLRIVADGFNNLDNMSQELDEFVQKFKKMSVKNLYLGVIAATVTGIFTGAILSYSYQFSQGDSQKWSEFAAATGAKLAQKEDVYSLKFNHKHRDFSLEQNQNGSDILYISPKK